MRKQLLAAIVVAGVFALFGSAPASAQESVSKVTVPFQFVVGETVLPAGSYTLLAVASRPDILSFLGANGTSVAAALVNTTGTLSKVTTRAQFSFKRIGGRYFLSEVSLPGCEVRALSLPKNRVESVLARLNGAGRPAV